MSKKTEDIDGANSLETKYGERFQGWFFFKSILRKETFPLNYKNLNLTYTFTICDYNYKFIMPEKILFNQGTISYTNGDRLLGVFRFPRNANGDFFTPLSTQKIQKKINEGLNQLSHEELNRMLQLQQPVVFNAFKIAQFGFEYIDISDFNINEIKCLTDEKFIRKIKEEFNNIIGEKVEEVKKKILSIPNYLLILQKVLDRQERDLQEVSKMTEKIITI